MPEKRATCRWAEPYEDDGHVWVYCIAPRPGNLPLKHHVWPHNCDRCPCSAEKETTDESPHA